MFNFSKKLVPGLILALALSVFAKIISPMFPKLGAEALAMLIGMVIGNTIFRDEKYASGVKYAEKYPIEVGIAMMGLTVTLTTIENLKWQGVVFILLQMILTIVFVVWLGGRIFKVSSRAAMLMGAGNAVCGSSAIAAVAPAIDANDEQRRTTVASVSLTGVMLLFLLPVLGTALYGNNDLVIGGLIGGTVQSVGQVIGAASLVNEQVVTYAAVFKMLRVVLLSVVVIIFSKLATKDPQQLPEIEVANKAAQKAKKKNALVPCFVVVFVILLFVNTFVSLPSALNVGAKEISGFCGIVNLAGIGLNLKWSTIKKSGPKFLAYGGIVGIFQTILAVGLLHLLIK